MPPTETVDGWKFICSDMWSNYLKVAMQQAGHAVPILDRFHVMKKFNEVINAVRAQESKQMKADGYDPLLKNARWTLLKRPENLAGKQAVKLQELMQCRHRSLLLSGFTARGGLSGGLSGGPIEGMNAKAKLAMKKAYGFKSCETIEIALYHQLGALPGPKTADRFCGRAQKKPRPLSADEAAIFNRLRLCYWFSCSSMTSLVSRVPRAPHNP